MKEGGQRRVIVLANVDEMADAFLGQQPLDRLLRNKIAIRSAEPRQQHDFATNWGDDLGWR